MGEEGDGMDLDDMAIGVRTAPSLLPSLIVHEPEPEPEDGTKIPSALIMECVRQVFESRPEEIRQREWPSLVSRIVEILDESYEFTCHVETTLEACEAIALREGGRIVPHTIMQALVRGHLRIRERMMLGKDRDRLPPMGEMVPTKIRSEKLQHDGVIVGMEYEDRWKREAEFQSIKDVKVKLAMLAHDVPLVATWPRTILCTIGTEQLIGRLPALNQYLPIVKLHACLAERLNTEKIHVILPRSESRDRLLNFLLLECASTTPSTRLLDDPRYANAVATVLNRFTAETAYRRMVENAFFHDEFRRQSKEINPYLHRTRARYLKFIHDQLSDDAWLESLHPNDQQEVGRIRPWFNEACQRLVLQPSPGEILAHPFEWEAFERTIGRYSDGGDPLYARLELLLPLPERFIMGDLTLAIGEWWFDRVDNAPQASSDGMMQC